MKKTTTAFICALLLSTGFVSAATTFTIGTAGSAVDTNNWPFNEIPEYAIDGSAGAKYHNFAKLNTGYIFTLGTGGATATGINFSTAGDAEERDPTSYKIYGSNATPVTSGTGPGYVFNVSNDFTLISSGVLALPTTRLTQGGNVAFSSNVSYSTFLLVFPTVKNAGSANSMQIGEARIQTDGGDLSNVGNIRGGQLVSAPRIQTVPGDLSYASDSIFSWDLASLTTTGRGTQFDGVDVGGNLSIDPSAVFKIVLGVAFDAQNLFWKTNQTWNVFDVVGNTTGNFGSFELYDTSSATVPVSYGQAGSFAFNSSTGEMAWSAVPEPTTALVGFLLGAALFRRRREKLAGAA